MTTTTEPTTDLWITTPKRVYHVYFCDFYNVWIADYRPVNPKTGKPWQASRELTSGNNVWCGALRGVKAELVRGPLPEFEVWSKSFDQVRAGYATQADALAVVTAHRNAHAPA